MPVQSRRISGRVISALTRIELLEMGRTVPIISGRKCIHSLFHLDTPSITVVVRTQHDPGTGPQFNYLPPHIAMDPIFSDTLTMRRKQLLDMLEQTQAPAYAKLVMEMIAELDFERGFHVLKHCMGHLQYLGAWEKALGAFQKKHGVLAAGVPATLEEGVRRETIEALRSRVTEPEHRFFLALLMNVTTRADLFALIAQRFPREEPAEIILRWLIEMTEVSGSGITVLDASFPATLGIAIEKQPDLFMEALRHFMSGGKKIPASCLRMLTAAGLKTIAHCIRRISHAGVGDREGVRQSHTRRRNGQEWIRTTEGVSQRIYSPPRLATSVPTRLVSPVLLSAAFAGKREWVYILTIRVIARVLKIWKVWRSLP